MKHALKKYFIPHEGNNYHPHILHTKRAFFYGGVFLVMKVVVIVFTLFLPSYVFVMPDVLQEQQDKILELTNGIRAREGLPALKPQTKLTASSELKADDMAQKSYFEHESPDGRRLADWLDDVGYIYKVAGENLAMGFTDAEDLVDAWVESPTHYANLIDKEYTEFGIGTKAGVFDKTPTVYVAQHFGLPREPEIGQQEIPAVLSSSIFGEDNTSSTTADEILHTIETSNFADIILSATDTLYTGAGFETTQKQVLPLAVYQKEASHVTWKELEVNKIQLTVRAYIVGAFETAVVYVKGYPIELFRSEQPYIYQGQTTIFETKDELFKVALMPTISIKTQTGEIIQDTIEWNYVPVISVTPLERYTHSKSMLSSFMSIFDVSRNIYLGFIIFFSIALLLKIFIQIRKQHYHVIGQTLLLIGMLVVLFKV
ncbi:MAG: CAP domain-containing protein [Candidatus Magasanikbacteria bacterium]